VTVRVPPVAPAAMQAFLRDEAVRRRLGAHAADEAALLAQAGGAPGHLIDAGGEAAARDAARDLLDAALAPPSPAGTARRALVAASSGVAQARGSYADMLDALAGLLHEQMRDAVGRAEPRHARHCATALARLETYKQHTQHNITPQLLTAALLDDLSDLLAHP
jgi:DNA polymerase-3 subunit delta'